MKVFVGAIILRRVPVGENKNLKNIVVLALFCSLSLTACGKKKQTLGGEALPPPAETQPETETKKDTSPDKNSEVGKLPPVVELPNKSEEGETRRPSKPRTPAPKNPTPAPTPKPEKEKSQKKEDDSADLEWQEGYGEPIVSSFNSAAAKEDFKKIQDGRTTGFKDSIDDLDYSGAGTDQMMEYFKELNSSVKPDQRRLNLKMAEAIESAQLTLPEADDQMSDVIIRLKMVSGETYTLVGASDGLTVTQLRQVNSESRGRHQVAGFLNCVDADETCENSYARLRFSDGSIVRVIFRQSVASFKFLVPELFDHHALVYWNAFIQNGIKGNRTTDTRLRRIEISTSEVVNGRSAVSVNIKSHNKVAVRFQGPLKVSAGNSVQVPMRKVKQVEEDNLFSYQNDVDSYYTDLLTRISLVKNTGRGQMRFALVLNREGYRKSPVIYMTVAHADAEVLTKEEIKRVEMRLLK